MINTDVVLKRVTECLFGNSLIYFVNIHLNIINIMATYIPRKPLTREEIDSKLDFLVEVLGLETIVDNINRYFDVDTAAWFVEELEKDYDLK